MTNDFEYDVAFSFNALDEGIATQLNDLLSPRLKTFIYSERQREIAGTDGQERFSEVYGKTARLVVVLFRPEWGETPWTRVEDTAISERCFKGGWSTLMFVQLDNMSTLPGWLPPTHVRFSFDDYTPLEEAATRRRYWGLAEALVPPPIYQWLSK